MSGSRASRNTWPAKGAALIFGTLLVAGCEHWDGGQYPRTVNFACEHGPGLTVEFRRNTARIFERGGPPIILQRRLTANGFWFESDTHSIRGQGRRLTYTVGRMVPMECWEVRGGWR